MLLALMLMYNGKTHYFFMVRRGSIVEQKKAAGNKLIKKYFPIRIYVSLFSAPSETFLSSSEVKRSSLRVHKKRIRGEKQAGRRARARGLQD